MDDITNYNQFIYGKFSDGNSDYRIVARTPELTDSKFLEDLYTTYKFWGIQSPDRPHKAVGIFRTEKTLVLVQVSPPSGQINRYFVPYRYVFIPLESVCRIGYRTFKLLPLFFQDSIPRIDRENSNLEKLYIPLLQEKISTEQKQQEIEIIKRCLNEKDSQGQPFLFSILAALINGQRVLINNLSEALAAEKYYLNSLLLLLPASCRSQVAIAVGNLDEQECDWAQLLIKTINPGSIRRLKNFIWLNRLEQKFVGFDDQNIFQSEYVDKVRRLIEEKLDQIPQLIEQLDSITDLSISLKTLADNPVEIFTCVHLLDDKVSRFIKTLASHSNTKGLEAFFIEICDIQSSNDDILDKINRLNKEPETCELISTLFQNFDNAKKNLAEFAKLTTQDIRPTFDEIITYVDEFPDEWDLIKKFYSQIKNSPIELIECLDRLLGKRDKFVVDILEERLKIITDQDLDEQFPQTSIAKKALLSSPQKYLPELLVRSEKNNYILTLTKCLLNEGMFSLIKGGIIHHLCVFWNQQRQPDVNLILKLINPSVLQYFDNQDVLKLASVLLYPRVEIPSSFKVDIRAMVKILVHDDKKYLIVSAKDIVSKLSGSEEIQSLLNNCELLGLARDELQEILEEAPSQSCNFKLIRKYIYSEYLLDQKEKNLVNKLLQTDQVSVETSELESFYIDLIVNLFKNGQYEEIRYYKQKITSQDYIDKSSFFAKLMQNIQIKFFDNLEGLNTIFGKKIFTEEEITNLKFRLFENKNMQNFLDKKIENNTILFEDINHDIKIEIQQIKEKIEGLTQAIEEVTKELRKPQANSENIPAINEDESSLKIEGLTQAMEEVTKEPHKPQANSENIPTTNEDESSLETMSAITQPKEKSAQESAFSEIAPVREGTGEGDQAPSSLNSLLSSFLEHGKKKMNRQPWYCMGMKAKPHFETENWNRNCSFPGCQEKKHLQIANRVLRLAVGLTILGVLAYFVIPKPNITHRFTYGGSTAFAPIRSKEKTKLIENAISKKIPGFHLVYLDVTNDKPGSGTGIKMLIEGQISFAQSSRPLRDEEVEKATKVRGFALKQIPVALDGIAVYVNPDLNISDLTLDQVRDLFTGKISNWKTIGGFDMPVTPISLSNEGKDTTDFFQRDVMGGKPFASSTKDVRDPTTAIREISAIPGSIGYASAPLVCNQITIKPIALARTSGESYIKPCIDKKSNIIAFDNFYPITYRLFVIYREDNSEDANAGEAYAQMLQSKEGQQLLKEAGFAPISGATGVRF